MLRIIKDKDFIKYKVYDNDVYLVQYDYVDIKDVSELINVVIQGRCTGCNFRPGDMNCKQVLRNLTMKTCETNTDSLGVYMRDELIYDYESRHNMTLISPNIHEIRLNPANRGQEGGGCVGTDDSNEDDYEPIIE